MDDSKQEIRQRLPAIREHWALFLVVGVACIAGTSLVSWGLWLVFAGSAPGPRTSQPTPTGNGSPAAQETLWTCSMHPQIKLRKPGLCPICRMKLIPLKMQDVATGGLRVLTVSENAKKLMEIETTLVERKFVTAEVRMVGKIDYDETRLAYITAWVPGRIDRMFVDYTGVPVRKGDHLVELYSPELLSAQEELLQAVEAVKELKASDIGIVRDTAEATVTAVREKLRLWGMTPEQIAGIQKRGKGTDRMTVYSPVGGIVIKKEAEQGMYVKTGTRIYTIADLSQVWVKLDAYESDLMWLRFGQKVTFTTVSHPGEEFTGTISFIDPVLSSRTRTVKVRVNAANLAGKLKPGMFVKAIVTPKVAAGGKVMDPNLAGKWMCRMHPSVVKDAPGKCDICKMPLERTETLGYASADPTKTAKPLVIPASAALRTGTRAIVYVEVPNKKKPTFEGREIVLGPRAGNYYLVRSGLAEGQRVVTRGSFKIDSSLQIQAKPSMMSPEGGGTPAHVHGKAKKKTPGEKSAAELPFLFKQQLHAVIAAAGEVNKAVANVDLPGARRAFASLEKATKAVDHEQIQGHALMLWKELSMRLTNDGVEGKDAETLKDAARVEKSLAKNIASLVSKLGIRHGKPSAAHPAVSAEFRKQLRAVFDAYFKMQQALASDRGDEALAAATKMAAALGSVDMNLLTGQTHTAWMKEAGDLKKTLTRASGAKGIEPVRKEFALLSEQMLPIARRFGPVSDSAIYQMKCEMAFNNRGAVWLQTSQKVRNPYYGAAMLTCGEIEEMLSPATGAAPASKPAGGGHRE